MSLYKKVNCTCGHEYARHTFNIYGDNPEEDGCDCSCLKYEAAGHNPELENVLCPDCHLVDLIRRKKLYVCVACGYSLPEKEVLRMVG